MKIKELKEKLNNYPDDMEVVFHYKSDLCVVYDNDFDVYEKSLGYCSYKSNWKENNEVYGNFYSSTYKADVGYDMDKGRPIYENIPLDERDVVVIAVFDR